MLEAREARSPDIVLGLEGDGEEERRAMISLYRFRPFGVPRRASLGERGGHCCSRPADAVAALAVVWVFGQSRLDIGRHYYLGDCEVRYVVWEQALTL